MWQKISTVSTLTQSQVTTCYQRLMYKNWTNNSVVE